MHSTSIAEFEVGRPVEGVYAVVAKRRMHNRNGDPYLALELSDSTGRIAARVWQNAEHFDRAVHTGDTVVATGKPVRFRDEVQLDVRRLQRVDTPEDQAFVPVASRDLGELAGELDFLVSDITDADLGAVVNGVWNGPHREQLLRAAATAAEHHAYIGGLVEHTVSVATICLAAADRHEHLNRELLLGAALLHDIGRAREVDVADQLAVPEDAALYGHVLLGHEWLLEVAGNARELAWWPQLIHAVTMHHGPLDRCRTREALTLASANALDVRLSGSRLSAPTAK